MLCKNCGKKIAKQTSSCERCGLKFNTLQEKTMIEPSNLDQEQPIKKNKPLKKEKMITEPIEETYHDKPDD